MGSGEKPENRSDLAEETHSRSDQCESVFTGPVFYRMLHGQAPLQALAIFSEVQAEFFTKNGVGILYPFRAKNASFLAVRGVASTTEAYKVELLSFAEVLPIQRLFWNSGMKSYGTFCFKKL